MDDFETPNPDYADLVRRALAAQGFLALIGAQVTEVGPGRCVVEVGHRDDLCQHDGHFHGGLLGTLADVTAAAAAGTLIAPGQSVLTVEYKINILAPGRGQRLIGEGAVIRPGRRLTICRSDVFSMIGGERRPCATALAAIAVLGEVSDSPE